MSASDLERKPLLESIDTKTTVSSEKLSTPSSNQHSIDHSNSSNLSLRFFKTHTGDLPTVWASSPIDGRPNTFPEISIRRRKSANNNHMTLTSAGFFMQILRGSIGTGVLALPSAIANAGLVFGSVGIVITSLAIIHSINLLVECAQHLRNRHNLHDVDLDYGTTVEYAFVFGTSSARRFRWASKILNICLGIVQYGIAVVYILFIAENVKYMVDHYSPEFQQPLMTYVGCVTVLVFPTIFIRTIRILSIISSIANVLMAVGISLILIYCIQDIPSIDQYPLITNIDRIPLFFGIAVFSFESINVVLPSENALRDKNIQGWNGILNLSFLFVLIVYFAIAFYGYLKFGDNVKGSITYSMPLTPWYSMIVKPIYATLIAMSFGLQFYILFEVIWHEFTSLTPLYVHKTWINCFLRVIVLILIATVSALVPHVEHIISLTGALAGSAICLIFPSLIHIILFWDQSYKFRCFNLMIAKNILLIAFGIFGAIIGSYTSVLAIYNAFQSNAE